MTRATTFDDGAAVFAYLVESHAGKPDANAVVVPLAGGGASRVDAIERHGEIWIRSVTEIGPQDEIDPDWALAHNVKMLVAALETDGTTCASTWCLPVGWLSRERMARLLDEADSERVAIREEFGIEDDDEQEDDDEDEEDDDEDEEDLGDD